MLGVTAIVLSQWERFAQPEYRVMRAGVFLSLGLSGVIPMLHTIIKNGPKGIALKICWIKIISNDEFFF